MSTNYVETKKAFILPRLPLEGNIDITYRCNNNCRHCWLSLPCAAKEKKAELSTKEIKNIVSTAKSMGCRNWSISGGEPMLREDFSEIFEYITSNSSSYSLNTNGTLVTLKIAKLLKKKGSKMVALYGATAEVHDHITRNPGSFEMTMRGFRYLKEAGAGFTVQLIPMRDNYHQLQEMIKLAESLSKHYRIGAPWLYLSACRDAQRNEEIRRQRLPEEEVLKLDQPDLSYEEQMDKKMQSQHCGGANVEYLFSSCVSSRRSFHVDPYGMTSFCCFVKDPRLRYDLRKGSFQECWNKFIPSLAKKIKVTPEYKKNCGLCVLRKDCRFCPVYAYLEHGNFQTKVDYLCRIAKENQKYKMEWQKNHRRFFKIAGITLQVDSDLPIEEKTFNQQFKFFEAQGPGEDTVYIRHHFSLPELNDKDIGKEVYRKPPWAIYQKGDSWIYLGISPDEKDKSLHRVAVFNHDHTSVKIYNDKEDVFRKGGLTALTLFPTDQIILGRILADRQGCYLHSCGVILDGKGLLFVGHSEAGKSTMATMLKGKAEILCDDRIVVRQYGNKFKIYGTWHHGTVPDVSGNSAPLKGIFFLEQAKENRLVPIKDEKEITKKLLAYLIKPFVTVDWWDKTLIILEEISSQIPCYILKFDKSGKVVDLLKKC